MTPNRIFCIGKNYADHVAELAHVGPSDDECVVFLKPMSCIVPLGHPIHLPRNRGAIHHEAEMVVRIGVGGSNIPADRAAEHIDGLSLGLDLTLRDLQTALRSKGKPWELAKAFDGAAPLGVFSRYSDQDLQAQEFVFEVNGQRRQHGQTKDMLYPVGRQIEILSQTWALQPGDLVYTGTPAGVGPLVPGDLVALYGPGFGRFEWTCE